MSWEEVKISEVYKGLYDGPHATPTLCNDGPIFLSIANVSETGQLDLTNTKHISESEYPKWTKRITPRENDLVFTYEASLHRYAIIPRNFVGCLGRRLALVRPDNNKAYYKYLFYYFLSDSWRKEVGNYILTGTTVDRVPLTKFPQFKILLPDLKTQKKIAAILSAYDDLLENNKRRIALLENMAEEIYREWFVRFRFPGYQTAEFEKGIPKGWMVGALSDVATINLSNLNKNNAPEYLEYIDIGSVTTNNIGKSEVYHRNEAPGRAKRLVKHGDIIWSSVRPGNRAYSLIFRPNKNLVVSTGFAVITPIQEEYYPFIYQVTTTDSFVDQITAVAKGAAYPTTSFDDYGKTNILIPDDKLIREYFRNCNPMYEEIFILKSMNYKLNDSKNMLLPRLISGKLPVEDLDIKYPPSMLQDAS